jgi:RNA polymerase sigma-70 factor (ECF subfamily)
METLARHSSSDVLLAAARAGDRSGFWQLAESYRAYLRNVAERLLQDQLASKVDASDVVQQCLVTAFEQFDQFRGRDREQWQRWMLALVRYRILRLVRYWRRGVRDVRREQALSPGSSGGGACAADGSSPSQHAARREQAARLIALIQQLPSDYREVIYLRNLEDLPYAVVARRMNRSELGVRKLWERAVKRLRQVCGDDL